MFPCFLVTASFCMNPCGWGPVDAFQQGRHAALATAIGSDSQVPLGSGKICRAIIPTYRLMLHIREGLC